MYPRHRIDISLGDLIYALAACTRPRDRAALAASLEREWSPAGEGLACLSVRSGFDLLLQALELPAGSEVLVSAVTIPDMPRILEAHGLRPLPMDIDLQALAPCPERLERALTPRTRAVLVAHLFGGRVDLQPIAVFCQRHGLLLWEDAAQAFRSPTDTGCPVADISMFSFGPIKTATALGGALCRVRDPELRVRMRSIQATWPVQPRQAFLRRVLQFLILHGLARPIAFRLLTGAFRATGRDLDAFIGYSVRGFSGAPEMFLSRIRRQPCAPLLALLQRRLQTFDPDRLARRAEAGQQLVEALPPEAFHPGSEALEAIHWVLPLMVPEPQALVAALRHAGFDAAQGVTSLGAVDPPPDRLDLAPTEARRMLEQVIFLPVYPEIPEREQLRLRDALADAVGSGSPR